MIEQNVETVVDWLNWLEKVEDESLKKKIDPAVEKLKKEIEKLWKKQLVVELQHAQTTMRFSTKAYRLLQSPAEHLHGLHHNRSGNAYMDGC